MNDDPEVQAPNPEPNSLPLSPTNESIEELRARLAASEAQLRQAEDDADSLAEHLKAELDDDVWIALAEANTMRASNIRSVERGNSPEWEDSYIDGKQHRKRWLHPSLLINGMEVKRPHWTHDELIGKLAPQVIQSPTPGRYLNWEEGSTPEERGETLSLPPRPPSASAAGSAPPSLGPSGARSPG